MSVKLSIITVNYDNHIGLQATTASILKQKVPISDGQYNWLIVDGGSSDGSPNFINSISSHLFWFCSERDGGIYQGMNKGIDHANGDFLFFLNSGDSFSNENTIETILELLKHHAYADIIRCRVNLMVKGHIFATTHPVREITGLYLFTEDIPHQGTIIRRTMLQKEHYDTQFRIIADMHFFRRAYMQLNAKDAVEDIVICDYDATGISATAPCCKLSEREKSWKQLFGERSYQDYHRLAYGQTFSETVVCRIRESKCLNALSAICLFPIRCLHIASHLPFILKHLVCRTK